MYKKLMALLLCAVISVAQADFIEGKLAYEAGDYALARQVFQQSVRGGTPDPDALYHLAWMYENGLGVEANQTIALSYYQRAAKLNQAKAQFALGYLYSIGSELMPQDFEKAMNWYTQAADNGDKDACYNLGAWYLKGFAKIKPNIKLANDWFQRGADLGSTESIYALAAIYLNGTMVKKDEKKAVKLLGQADLMGYAQASFFLGKLYFQGGELVPKDLSLAYYYFLRAKALNYINENLEFDSPVAEGELKGFNYKSEELEGYLSLLKTQLPREKVQEIQAKIIAAQKGAEIK